MDIDNYKKYTIQAKRGIKGEAFFESLIADYSLPHQIVGSKDIGLDYICEWVYPNKPSGILFAVQIKTFSEKTAKPKLVDENDKFNGLDKFEIKNSNFKKIDEKILHYWKGLEIPIYLFALCIDKSETSIDCYYKRFIDVLSQDTIDMSKIDYYSDFFKVNDGSKFRAFSDPAKRIKGFARDLFIDYMRWNYYRGSITYLDPRKIGLSEFPEYDRYSIFTDLFDMYKDKLFFTFDKLTCFLKKYYPDKFKEMINIYSIQADESSSQAPEVNVCASRDTSKL